MAGNFMSKPVAKPVAPKKKPAIKGLKPRVPKPIENTPTLKEVEEKAVEEVVEQVVEPIVEQAPEPEPEEIVEIPEPPVQTPPVPIDPETNEPFEEEDDKLEEKEMEEIIEDANQEEPEEVIEEEKPKAKKKTSRKKSAKKETKQDTTIVIDSEPLSVEEYKDYMTEVIRPSIQEWEDEKEEIRDKMSTLNLDPNMNPKEIRQLLADLTDMHKEMQDRLEEAKVNLENTTELIKSVEIKAAVEGCNSEERKLKALIAKENYVKEGETQSVNLTVFKQLLNERVLFYNCQINTLEYNKFLVMTFQKVCSTETKGF